MTRKVGPPGWREHMLMNRLDGFVGGPSHIPSALATHIIAGTPSLRGRTEVEIIHARMKRRQLDYDFREEGPHRASSQVWAADAMSESGGMMEEPLRKSGYTDQQHRVGGQAEVTDLTILIRSRRFGSRDLLERGSLR
jgi:hypothetical protein